MRISYQTFELLFVQFAMHIGTQPHFETVFVECASGKIQHRLSGTFFAGNEPISVQLQKEDTDRFAVGCLKSFSHPPPATYLLYRSHKSMP